MKILDISSWKELPEVGEVITIDGYDYLVEEFIAETTIIIQPHRKV